ncbi:MAG: TetR family transcriptional regulator [SAR324 cluster bacterium]|nr:TetR family transcriptional regulator [SAR324 cluster bacterium]
MTKAKIQTRNADATKRRIFNAAYKEFAQNGFAGARVDQIAKKAKANKRMIYQYFGNKEALFSRVLMVAYNDIREEEKKLELDHLKPEKALSKLVEFTWDYYLSHPEFMALVNSANLHKARHLSDFSIDMTQLHSGHVTLVKNILDRGVASGVFRKGVDAVQLCITIAAVGYYYLTNRYSGSILFGMDFMEEKALKTRGKFNKEVILRLVKTEKN